MRRVMDTKQTVVESVNQLRYYCSTLFGLHGGRCLQHGVHTKRLFVQAMSRFCAVLVVNSVFQLGRDEFVQIRDDLIEAQQRILVLCVARLGCWVVLFGQCSADLCLISTVVAIVDPFDG